MNAKTKKQLRALGKLLFAVYIVFLLYFLIFSDWYGRTGVMENYHYNLIPFQEIRRFWEYREKLGIWSIINLLGNVIIFIPFGFFKPMSSVSRNFLTTVLDGVLLSMVVEVFQFVTKVGRFDVDDLLLNTFGVVIGYLVFLICNVMRRKYGKKRKRTQK